MFLSNYLELQNPYKITAILDQKIIFQIGSNLKFHP